MTYVVLTLPADPTARARRVAFERAQGGTIYLRPDTTHVLARESWPLMTPPLPALPADRTGWVEIAA